MYDYFESEKAKKKALTAAEKKELKKAKDDMELKYITCMLDGRKEKVGNFRVEPPGLFRGRGEHPKKGSLKVKRLSMNTVSDLTSLIVSCTTGGYHSQHRQGCSCTHTQHAWTVESYPARQHCYLASDLDGEHQPESQVCVLGCGQLAQGPE